MIRGIVIIAALFEALTLPLRWLMGEVTFVVIDTFLESLGL